MKWVPRTSSVEMDNIKGPCETPEIQEDVVNEDLSLNVLFEECEKLHQNVPGVVGSAKPSQEIGENIIIDRVRAATIKVPMVISGMESKAVIDTGAELTV